LSQPLQETRRARAEPEAEASRLYHEYHDRILRYCAGQLRSREEAEDAVQNTFLRVFTALRKGVVPEFEGPWLYKIAHNVCLSKRLGTSRRARVETPVDLDLLGDRAAAYSADSDELFGLDDALADMPPNLRRPLLMREWQGMSYAEIAESLGVSHSAVETLIFRARRHLASALTDSVRKSGKAIASIFNIRWLFNLLRGLGGGAGATGMAAGAAGLVVAIGGGVAIDLATQHASASHAVASGPIAGTPIASRRSNTSRPAGSPQRASTGASSAAAGPAHGTHGRAPSHGSSGSHPGGSAPSGGSSSGGSSAPSSGVAPGPSSHHSGSSSGKSGSTGSSAPKHGSPGNSSQGGLPTLPLPPVPSLPPIAPPSLPPPPVLPPAPALPPAPPLPAAPTISVPGNLTAEATGPLGAVVAYTVTATNADGSVPVTCTPAAGSTFALGHTTVSCSATDTHGSVSRASFDVLVRDTTPPALSVPGDISVQTTLASGAKVSYTATATDLVDPAPKVSCSPASGSLFLVQTTTVTCTATDSSGNSSSKTFHVTVTLAPPVPAPPLAPPPSP
jgi:RNA polymerase sigma factor (sigma-70 family)